MDFLAFKKKHYAPLQAYLRQNDLDPEEEEEEQQSEVISDEVKILVMEMDVMASATTSEIQSSIILKRVFLVSFTPSRCCSDWIAVLEMCRGPPVYGG